MSSTSRDYSRAGSGNSQPLSAEGIGAAMFSDQPGSSSRADAAKANPDKAVIHSDSAVRMSAVANSPTSSASPVVPTDEQLLADYVSGDRAAFAALVSRYQRELYHFLVRFLGNRATAEDVFQDAFLQVHQSAAAFDPQRRFKPWLFTIAANKARDLIRAQARRPANPLQASIGGSDDEGSEFIDLMQSAVELPEEPMARQEMQEKVQRVIAQMPEHLREVLVLSYFNTFPYRQIAEILGIPLGTVKSRLHAAVATFAERWKTANHRSEVS